MGFLKATRSSTRSESARSTVDGLDARVISIEVSSFRLALARMPSLLVGTFLLR